MKIEPFDYEMETILAHFAEDPESQGGAIVPPIYQNTLFAAKDWEGLCSMFDDQINHCLYTRGGNPTVRIVEEKIAKLAGGERAKLLSSGMAAITAAILHYLKHGDHVIAVRNIYGSAHSFLGKYVKEKMNVDTTFVDGKDVGEFEAAIRPNTTLIYLESPTTAIFELQDIPAIVGLAKKHGIKTVIDNTWATFLFQKPLEMGVDLEVHSCTKYINGHSDVIAGAVIGRAEDVDSIFMREHILFGAKMAPIEAWLILRGMRTLPLRLQRHQENTMKVAKYLEQHPKVLAVRYPGLESYPQYELGKKLMTGYTGLFSIRLDCAEEQVRQFFNALKIFKLGVSWGGHESLCYSPAISYYKKLPYERFVELGLSLCDVRLSIGLENPDDLIADLEDTLRKI